MIENIDCTGFNFHCPENRSYLIFDPQSQDENDRLDQLLGATQLWQASIEKKRRDFGPAPDATTISPFSELHPIGWTPTGEAIGIVLAGAIGNHNGTLYVSGQWFAVRVSAGSETELTEDLAAELQLRKQKLMENVPPGSITSIEGGSL